MRNLVATIGLSALAMAMPASATNLITNGSFEQGAPASGCVAGTTALSGWNVTAGNIDIDSATCSGISAADGTFWVDLTGSGAENGRSDVGTISQTVATQVGARYSLSFFFGANPQAPLFSYPNDSAIKSMNVLVDGVVDANFTLNTTGVASTNPQWAYQTLYFTATSTTTDVAFQSLNGISAASDFGPLLDGVSMQQVPEPATLGLMALGLVGAGLARRRKS